MNKNLKNKQRKNNKILFTILFSTILVSGAKASILTNTNNFSHIEKQNITSTSFYDFAIKDKVKDIFDNIEDKKIDLSNYTPSPFEIQGRFETNWNVNNYWNGNDNGGVAVGPFQIHSRYMLVPFFEYLKENNTYYFDLLNANGGVKAIRHNDANMKKFFCELCQKDKEFVKLQAQFIDKNNFQPRLKVLKNQYGLDISKRSKSIEGLFRTMSANIGWKTNYVVEEMIREIGAEQLNHISDKEFVEVLHKSLTKVLNEKIQKRFRAHLLSAYDATIKNDVIPNLYKPMLTKTEKLNQEYKNRNQKAKSVIASLQMFFDADFIKREQNNFIKIISEDTSDNFVKSKKIIMQSIIKHMNQNYKFDIAKNKTVAEKKKQSVKIVKQDIFVKNDDDVNTDTPIFEQKKEALPPKKNDIITVESVIANNKNPRPSLLRKAEIIRMNELLENAVNIMNGKNEKILKKTIETTNHTSTIHQTKKSLYAEKRANELNVENIITKAKSRKDNGAIKPQNDFSDLFKEASSYFI